MSSCVPYSRVFSCSRFQICSSFGRGHIFPRFCLQVSACHIHNLQVKRGQRLLWLNLFLSLEILPLGSRNFPEPQSVLVVVFLCAVHFFAVVEDYNVVRAAFIRGTHLIIHFFSCGQIWQWLYVHVMIVPQLLSCNFAAPRTRPISWATVLFQPVQQILCRSRIGSPTSKGHNPR